MSDKPAWVQALPRRDEPAYDLRTRCEETMGVDWAVAQVTAALEETGRLDDTLLVFTADNGYLIGDHRIEDKLVPYATPVPLYVRWPSRWGDEARTIDRAGLERGPGPDVLRARRLRHGRRRRGRPAAAARRGR